MSTPFPSADPWDTPYSESKSSGFPDQCKNFSEGRHCKLWNKGRCPFMHDFGVRMAALDEIRKRNATKGTALRERHDQERAATKVKAQLNRNEKSPNQITNSNALRPLHINATKSSSNPKKSSSKGKHPTIAPIISISVSKENNISTNVNLLKEKPLAESSKAASKAPESIPVAKRAKKSTSKRTIGSNSKVIDTLAPTASVEVSTSLSGIRPFVVTKVDGQTCKKAIAKCQGNWKKDPAILASRLKLSQLYEQSIDKNLADDALKSLDFVHVPDRAASSTTLITKINSTPAYHKIGRYPFKDDSPTSALANGEGTFRNKSSVDISCILDVYTDSRERHSLVLIPHEEVIKFVRAVENEHKVEICHAFVQDKPCSSTYAEGCSYSHNTHYRQQVWKAMKNYMKAHHPTYDQENQRFTSDVTQYDPKSNGTITYLPLPTIASKNVVPNLPSRCEYTKKIETMLVTTPVSFPIQGNDWVNDQRVQLFAWAKANLSPATRAKHLKSYLEQGEIPMEATDMLPASRISRDVFLNFPRLPGELRNRIWEYAIDAQPIDCLVKQGWEYVVDGNKLGRRLEQISCGNPFLYVNSESRSLVLPRHEITFGNQFHCGRILFDYERDRLFLITKGYWDFCDIVKNMFVQKDRRRIRFLMIPLRDYLQHKEDTYRSITSFSHLETVWFIVGDGKEEERWSKDKHLANKIGNGLQKIWLWRFRKQKPEIIPRTPIVILNVIPAQVMHGLKIDGCPWAR